jgi:hypothetical protein
MKTFDRSITIIFGVMALIYFIVAIIFFIFGEMSNSFGLAIIGLIHLLFMWISIRKRGIYE